MIARSLGFVLLLFVVSPSPQPSQKVYSILLRHPSADLYRFEPATVTARPGDQLEFTVEGGGPYVIGFEPGDLDIREQGVLSAAMPDRSAPLRSPVLPRPGSRYGFTIPALPAGRYRFAAVTHMAYQMAGVLVIP